MNKVMIQSFKISCKSFLEQHIFLQLTLWLNLPLKIFQKIFSLFYVWWVTNPLEMKSLTKFMSSVFEYYKILK